jgi:hypothetical protein
MSERMTDERLADYEFDDDGCQLLAYFKAERSRVAELEAKLKDRHRRLTAMQLSNAPKPPSPQLTKCCVFIGPQCQASRW